MQVHLLVLMVKDQTLVDTFLSSVVEKEVVVVVQVVEQVEMKLQITAVVTLHQYLHLKEIMAVNHQVLLGMVVAAVVEQEE